jgi:hypothetical protein
MRATLGVLTANGFPEAAEWIHQPHIYKQLKDIAERRDRATKLSGMLCRLPEGESAFVGPN